MSNSAITLRRDGLPDVVLPLCARKVGEATTASHPRNRRWWSVAIYWTGAGYVAAIHGGTHVPGERHRYDVRTFASWRDVLAFRPSPREWALALRTLWFDAVRSVTHGSCHKHNDEKD